MSLPPDVRALFAGRNYAHLATVGPAGPTSVPVWIDVEGDRLVFFTQSGSRKARNIARDPRVALSVVDRVGTLEAGTDADIVVLDSASTPSMRLRSERIKTLAEELFLMQTLGDDRAVKEVYVAGKPAKSDLVVSNS